MVSLGFNVSIGERRLPGWIGSEMFYVFMCLEHGVVIGHIHGYDRHTRIMFFPLFW